MTPSLTCSFCDAPQAPERPLISGRDGRICEDCVDLAGRVVESWGRKRKGDEALKPPPVPVEIKAHLDAYVIGQDAAKETLAVAVYNHYKRLAVESEPRPVDLSEDDRVEIEKSNILITGPSGTGKTLLARTLARFVGVPFVIVDATSLTQAGYVGEDVESILSRLLEAADGNAGLAEWGIVYIDEIDKLARSSDAGHGVRDVSGEGVQQALLKLVEGDQVKVPGKGRHKDGDGTRLDTRNVLFIAGGAFEGLDDIVRKGAEPKGASIGFHATFDEDEPETDLQAPHASDLRRFGLIPEFIGRFPVVASVEPLDETALVRILTEPRNALIKQYRRLFEYEGVDLVFTDEALSAVARRALTGKTGARGLRGVLERVLRKSMFELPSMEDVDGCTVTEAVVEGDEEIEFTAAEVRAEAGSA